MITRRKLLCSAALAAPALILPSRKLLARSMHGTGGGGGGGYVASAIHLDGSADIHIAALLSTDNSVLSIVGWRKLTQEESDIGNSLIVIDPDNNYAPSYIDNGSGLGTFGSEIDVCNTDGGSFVSATQDTDLQPVDAWAVVITTIDVTAAPICIMYQGEVKKAPNIDGSSAFTIATNGLPFWFGNDSFGNFVQGDVADWRFMPGISLLNLAKDDISEATRRLFIDADGKPVDPTIATAALGAAGAVLFSGDDTTFAVNQGTGGATITSGTLTNATTSPSD